MRVLHVLNELKYSGMECMLYSSASEWVKHEVVCEILATGINEGPFAEELRRVNYPVFHIPYPKRSKAAAALRSLRLLRKEQYDIVHIHTEANFLLHVLEAKSAGIASVIRTFHSVFRPRLRGHIRRICDRRIADCFGVRYVSPSATVADNELRRFKSSSHVIYNWYDDQRFQCVECGSDRRILRNALGIPVDTFVIVTVGNCAPVKQHELLISALSLLPKDLNWIYVHAGQETASHPERALAARLGIGHKCRFLGAVQSIETLLPCADVYVMCSAHEGFGIAALEAMACGCVTLMTRVPGLQELLEIFRDARGVASSSKALADEIVSISALSRSRREEIQKNVARVCRERFSVRVGVESYAQVYKHMIACNCKGNS